MPRVKCLAMNGWSARWDRTAIRLKEFLRRCAASAVPPRSTTIALRSRSPTAADSTTCESNQRATSVYRCDVCIWKQQLHLTFRQQIDVFHLAQISRGNLQCEAL